MSKHPDFDAFRRGDSTTHPENDLVSDADYANRYRPEPHTLEELSNIPDPVEQARRNQQSTKQAVIWAIATPILTLLAALILAIISRTQGGPICEEGDAVWICTRAAEIWWPLATSGVAWAGTIGSGIVLWRKYKNYTRWRPWMCTFRATLSWTVLWMLTTMTMVVIGH